MEEDPELALTSPISMREDTELALTLFRDTEPEIDMERKFRTTSSNSDSNGGP
jgi:hypothetical protein